MILEQTITWLKELHSASGIMRLVEAGGPYLLIGIIFAETGLLVGFFLPGDSLLITAGVLANPLNPHYVSSLDIVFLNVTLAIAGIIGDQTGYYLGSRAGQGVWNKPDGRFFKKRYLLEAHEFYQKYGGLSVVAARYVPIVRTFVPFVAGMAKMPYRKFVFWNIFGGILWTTSLLWVGYYLGQTPLANRLDKIILLVIFISVLPMVFGIAKRWLSTRAPSANRS